MRKLKVKKTYFDRVEDRYVYPEKEPVIEREEKRAEVLIDAGVVEEWKPESEGTTPPATEGEVEAPAETTVEEKPAEKEKGKGKSKK